MRVVKRYIDFLIILLIPIPAAFLLRCSVYKCFLVLFFICSLLSSKIQMHACQDLVMLEKSVRIILCDLKKITHFHIVCDINLYANQN